VALNSGKIRGTKVINDGAWHHVAIVMDDDVTPNADDILIYIDGAIDLPLSTNPVPINTNGSGKFRIGADVVGSAGDDDAFSGCIDEVRVWNSARTQPEIEANKDKVVGSNHPDLALYYRMNDGPMCECAGGDFPFLMAPECDINAAIGDRMYFAHGTLMENGEEETAAAVDHITAKDETPNDGRDGTLNNFSFGSLKPCVSNWVCSTDSEMDGTSVIEIAENGDFESEDFTDWDQFNKGVFNIASPGQSGNFAANLSTAGTLSTNPLIKNANIGVGIVEPGDQIQVSFWARGETANGGVAIAEFFSELSGGGTSSSEILGGAPLSLDPNPNTWKEFSYNVTAGVDVSGGVTLQLAAISGGTSGSMADIYYDNVSVVVTTCAMPPLDLECTMLTVSPVLEHMGDRVMESGTAICADPCFKGRGPECIEVGETQTFNFNISNSTYTEDYECGFVMGCRGVFDDCGDGCVDRCLELGFDMTDMMEERAEFVEADNSGCGIVIDSVFLMEGGSMDAVVLLPEVVDMFQIIQPTTFPDTLHPGEDLPLEVEYNPTEPGLHTVFAVVCYENNCGCPPPSFSGRIVLGDDLSPCAEGYSSYMMPILGCATDTEVGLTDLAGDPEISDPCGCEDPRNAVDPEGNIVRFHDVIRVDNPGFPFQTWELESTANTIFLDSAGTIEIIAADWGNGGTQIPETNPGDPAGIYELDVWYLPNTAVDITLANGPSPDDEENYTSFGCDAEACLRPIPTMGEWGLAILSFLLLIMSTLAIRQRMLTGSIVKIK
jgi:hypothetical protein